MEIASTGIFLSKSSLMTLSLPILSNLSKATVKSINLSEIFAYSAKPDNIFRLLICILMEIFKSLNDFK